MKPAIRSRLLALVDGCAQLTAGADALRDQVDLLRARRDEIDRVLEMRAWTFPLRGEKTRQAEDGPLRAEREQVTHELERLQGRLAAAVSLANQALEPTRALVAAAVTAPIVSTGPRALQHARPDELRRLIVAEAAS